MDKNQYKNDLLQLYKRGVSKGLSSGTKCIESSIKAMQEIISESDDAKLNEYVTLNQSYDLTLTILNKLLDSMNEFKDELSSYTTKNGVYTKEESNIKDVN